ncbi:MAG: bifunctional glutamate--cysteine ligase GshA/glutathione synthetase GshB [Oscillospiraceae bacterium]|nr:bifunctional glutamate--cysteine ligase GshA/glutathione synthetase GshB [Oscillospiraceae bacterium]
MDLKDVYKLPEMKELLLASAIGLEKENIRVHQDGNFSLTPHPFGNKAKHPFILTDFSEAQVEIGTEVCSNPDQVYDQLENLHDIVTTTVAVEYPEPEFLWPMSNPPLIASEKSIPVAKYEEEDKAKETYREYLAEKYGKKIMLYCGIHYNFSFDERLIRRLHQLLGRQDDPRNLKSEVYLTMAKNCYLYSWFPVLMTAASPIFHESFLDEGTEVGGGRFLGYSSMRNSKYGYWNKSEIILDYSSLDAYINSIVGEVRKGELHSSSEFYTPVRLKPKGKYLMRNLRETGVNHIELRMFDLNPLDKNGMSKTDMELMEYFLLYLATKPDFDYNEYWQHTAHENHLNGAAYDPDSVEIVLPERTETLRQAASRLIDEMEEFYREIDVPEAFPALASARERVEDPEKLYSHRVYREIEEKGYVNFGIECAKRALEKSNEQYYLLKGFEDLELSTQAIIKACLKLGVKYEVLDRVDNFVRLKKDDRVEYVKQATKTSRDNCASILLMRNKRLTKQILAEHGIPVPRGDVFTGKEEAMTVFRGHAKTSCAVKPAFTNYGKGITVFSAPPTEELFEKALDIAFSNSTEILVEEFIPGDDYRFLVIGGALQAVSKRIPAYVVGDGVRPIRDLIVEKSSDPRRGPGHKKPLAFIGMGAEEALHLQMHGMSFMTIPEKGEVVTLRQNSNVSTGGDAIDCTDVVHPSYREIAVKAAASIGAVFCGVDIISEDITKPADESIFAVTELNFNPSIKIHCYPSAGQPRPIGEAVVRFLFDMDTENGGNK